MARLTIKLLKLEAPFVIAIDRTEWQLGKAWVNVLLLSVGYKGVSLPLFWTVLEEKGCSDNAERRGIVQQFIDEFGAGSIEFVTADREFASKEWLTYLVERKISFRLRIKANTLITDKRGQRIHASKMLKTMKKGERAELRRRRRLWNKAVFVAVCRKADGDNVIVVSSERTGRILLEYGQRWQIETLFGCLKTRGFRLEDTHLTHGSRVSNLLSLLTLATVWGILAGEIAARQTPPKIKKHGRAEKSIFRLGLENLRNCFCGLTTNFRQKQRFQQLTLLLSCT
jgi:transposase